MYKQEKYFRFKFMRRQVKKESCICSWEDHANKAVDPIRGHSLLSALEELVTQLFFHLFLPLLP